MSLVTVERGLTPVHLGDGQCAEVVELLDGCTAGDSRASLPRKATGAGYHMSPPACPLPATVPRSTACEGALQPLGLPRMPSLEGVH
jgi:hypothetical protein